MELIHKDIHKKNEGKRILLLVTVVERDMGTKVAKLLSTVDMHYHLNFLGRGTARLDVLDFLGLDESQKDVVFSVATDDKIKRAMRKLKEDLHMDKPGHGIAFTVPLASVSGKMTLDFMSGVQNLLKEAAKK